VVSVYDPDYRVDVVATAIADLKGIARLTRALATGRLPLAEVRAQLGRQSLAAATPDPSLFRQLVRFGAIGLLSTFAYLVIFTLTRGWLGAQPANLFALLTTTIANTAANRRITFGISGRHKVAVQQLQGLGVFAMALALTSGSLAILHLMVSTPHRALELGTLIVANLTATLLRFVLLRRWVFARAA